MNTSEGYIINKTLVKNLKKEIEQLRTTLAEKEARVVELEEQMAADVNLLRVKGKELTQAREALQEIDLYLGELELHEQAAIRAWRTKHHNLLVADDGD